MCLSSARNVLEETSQHPEESKKWIQESQDLLRLYSALAHFFELKLTQMKIAVHPKKPFPLRVCHHYQENNKVVEKQEETGMSRIFCV